MIKSEELANPNSCLSKAKDDEMVFVLLGRDVAAPAAIQEWIDERIDLEKNTESDAQIQEAYACIDRMIEYQKKLGKRDDDSNVI